MNCRRVRGLLSAYLDAELSGDESIAVRCHLNECASCRREYQSLEDTKRLLGALAHRASRAEIESLLHCGDAAPQARPLVSSEPRGVLRPRPLAATALLSVAGLWLATTALDRGSSSASLDEADAGGAPLPAASLNAGVLPSGLAPSMARIAATMGDLPEQQQSPYGPDGVPAVRPAALPVSSAFVDAALPDRTVPPPPPAFGAYPSGMPAAAVAAAAGGALPAGYGWQTGSGGAMSSAQPPQSGVVYAAGRIGGPGGTVVLYQRSFSIR